MSDGALLVMALATATFGMAAFALVNEVHWRQLFGPRSQTASMRMACKGAGTGFLGVSFLLCLLADPVTMAILVWPMLLGIAAAIVAAVITATARHRTRG